MIHAVVLCAAFAAVNAKIGLPQEPQLTSNGRALLEIQFEELEFPVGKIQHEVATADTISVDGVAYETKCVSCVESATVATDACHTTFAVRAKGSLQGLIDTNYN
jgi:hypothetical protein